MEHVERVLYLAHAQGPLWLTASALAGAALFVPLVLVPPHALATTVACGCYLLATFAVTFAGNFPVPMLGAGAGPVLGWYALLAGVAASSRR